MALEALRDGEQGTQLCSPCDLEGKFNPAVVVQDRMPAFDLELVDPRGAWHHHNTLLGEGLQENGGLIDKVGSKASLMALARSHDGGRSVPVEHVRETGGVDVHGRRYGLERAVRQAVDPAVPSLNGRTDDVALLIVPVLSRVGRCQVVGRPPKDG